MKVAVIGGRDFSNYELLVKTINDIKGIDLIVSGGALGADSMGAHYANHNNIPTLIFKPDWRKYGKGAGFIRNKDIINNSDIVVAFWDGKSKGTRNSIDTALKLNKDVRIIKYETI